MCLVPWFLLPCFFVWVFVVVVFFPLCFFFGFEYIIILKKNYEKLDKLLLFYFHIKLNVFFVFDANKKSSS